jgi:hypothetical protein
MTSWPQIKQGIPPILGQGRICQAINPKPHKTNKIEEKNLHVIIAQSFILETVRDLREIVRNKGWEAPYHRITPHPTH